MDTGPGAGTSAGYSPLSTSSTLPVTSSSTYSPVTYPSLPQPPPPSADNLLSDPSSVSPYWTHPAPLRVFDERRQQYPSTYHERRGESTYRPSWSSTPSGPRPPPPVLQHKVYKIHCASCDTFLSDRGMKAVLLLRPNISLYSTDALPVNCSTPPRSSAPSSSEPPVPRTCECLTQSLCCHGCGNPIGYAIVMPSPCQCSKCSSSVTRHQNTANGHRFVFHQSEVSASERLYVKGEPGVIPYHVSHPSTHHSLPRVLVHHMDSMNTDSTPIYDPLLDSDDDDDRDEDGEYKHPSPVSSPDHPEARIGGNPGMHAHPLHPRPRCSRRGRRLKPGEVIWWHNLARSGDLPGVDPHGAEEDVNVRMMRLRRSMKCMR
ncbi:FAM72 protein-domain-containing protein [Cantharellus anzutake]|uniref:FAM72 protein-domain-containing protein n=1 Tax=Cantharellus anzutake TaxID=1750568 RepID=UPI001906669E|nr:FAM72 protein-domain-containing protein [Cantharellus anzutake]KAF8342345.1 FAM72 protein-domain-containing protein [Cantharellus anzutake]